MTERYKQDAAYELVGVEQQLASARRSSENTENPNSRKIADGKIVALERRRDALKQEVETLPERPVRQWGVPVGAKITPSPEPRRWTQEELDNLEIPDFLKRTK